MSDLRVPRTLTDKEGSLVGTFGDQLRLVPIVIFQHKMMGIPLLATVILTKEKGLLSGWC